MGSLSRLLAPLALILALAGSAGALGVGEAAPDIGGAPRNGGPGALSSLRGKVVLLEFWRTW